MTMGTLRFEPEPERVTGEQVVFAVELAPREARSLFMEVTCGIASTQETCIRRGFFRALRDARRSVRTAAARAARIETSNEVFNEA
jgi:hypothetical protein